ncbi:MAG: IS1634 family transposase [Bacteroidota bacterium]
MFYREKKNKSGSISIQILVKEKRKNRLVKTIGSSKDPEIISSLVLAAKDYIAKRLGQQVLFESDRPDSWFDSVFSAIESIRLVGPELILGKIFNEIGFNAIEDDLFRNLVISRLIYPSSKLKTIRYLSQFRGVEYQPHQVYRYLDKLHNKQKRRIEQISYNHTLSILKGEPSVVFYDVTTIYFEAEKEDDLRIAGFSKEGKHKHPQILLGLLVSEGGYPLAYDIHSGNTYEGHTLIPILNSFKDRFSLQRLTVIADAGLLTKTNLAQLKENEYDFILGARIKSETNAIKKKLLSLSLKNGESKVIQKEEGLKLIVSFSESRAKKDQKNREKGLERLEKSLSQGKLTKSNINNRGYNKYLTMKGEVDISIDYEKYKLDAQWDGLKGYYTNIQQPSREIIDRYNELWMIEKAFRISKTDLRIRPIYHRLQNRIQAHICLSFAAYKVYKELERQLKERQSPFTITETIEMMQSINAITIKHEKLGQQTRIKPQSQKQIELLNLFEIQIG